MTIQDFKVKTVIKVQWGEMDAFRHVNNVSYVRWGETARIDYFNAMQFFDSAPEKMEYAPILGFQSVKYIAPIVYPDTIEIGTKTEEIKDDRIILKSYFFSQKQHRLVAIKTHEVIIFDYKTNSKIQVPESVIAKIHKVEGISV